MSRSLRDPAGRSAILSRLAALPPGRAPCWGRMAPEQLLPHLADGLRLALGELHRPSRAPHPLKAAVRRLLAIYLLPWPKGKIEAPAGAFTTPSAGWDADRAQVVALVERLAAATASQVAPVHPHFGRMSLGDWGVLQYRHMDHHLRQFGV